MTPRTLQCIPHESLSCPRQALYGCRSPKACFQVDLLSGSWSAALPVVVLFAAPLDWRSKWKRSVPIRAAPELGMEEWLPVCSGSVQILVFFRRDQDRRSAPPYLAPRPLNSIIWSARAFVQRIGVQVRRRTLDSTRTLQKCSGDGWSQLSSLLGRMAEGTGRGVRPVSGRSRFNDSAARMMPPLGTLVVWPHSPGSRLDLGPSKNVPRLSLSRRTTQCSMFPFTHASQDTLQVVDWWASSKTGRSFRHEQSRNRRRTFSRRRGEHPVRAIMRSLRPSSRP